MSRTRLTILVALGLVAVSAGIFFTRRATGGVDIGGPAGVSSWEVTLTAQGRLPADAETPVVTSAPPDFRRQHVSDESWWSDALVHRPGRSEAAQGTDREREALWKRRPTIGQVDEYRLTYTFRCVLGAHHPTPAMREATRKLDGPPAPETDGTLRPTPRVQSDHRDVEALARELAGNADAAADQVRAFHDHVFALPNLWLWAGHTALDCLRSGGDDAGKSRLVVALCRSRGVPARVVTGLVLNPNAPPALHHWAEAWVRSPDGPEGHWLPSCPTYGHLGARRWPANYLVVRLDDEPLVRGPGEPRLSLFARQLSDGAPAGESPTRAFWRAVSLASLPPAEQQFVQFLLLLPLAAVIVSVFRVVIGVRTFGVFAPALLGLIFRDLQGLPWGLGIFAAAVLIGWLFRKVLDRFHLLLIPRAAVLLTVVVLFLLVVVVAASRSGVHVTSYLALFPLVILTHMVERFWTVEAEDSSWTSFKTLLGTLGVSAVVALALSPEAVGRWVFRYPETLGVVIAVLLLLGRYTGYRVTELYRFQDVIEYETKDEGGRTKEEGGKATPTTTASPAGA
jgi:transglutaminase-like putative cysteine protease